MEEKKRKVDIQQLSDFLLDYAVSLMGVGSHTARIVRNTSRIAKSFGYEMDMIIFQRNLTMTVEDPDDHSISRTYVRNLKHLPINLKKISKLSALSWDCYDNNLAFSELKNRYNLIMNEKPISRWIILLAAAIGNMAFCKIFQGDFVAMGIVFVSTLIGFFIRQELMNRHIDHRLIFFITAFVSSMIASSGIYLDISNTAEVAVTVSVLFLIPGVPIINSMIDIIEGHVIIGFSRAINASILIICIALGLYLTLIILGVGKL